MSGFRMVLTKWRPIMAAILLLPFEYGTVRYSVGYCSSCPNPDRPFILKTSGLNTVTIRKPDIHIPESLDFRTYLCPVFEWSFTILFPVRFSNGLIGKINFYSSFQIKQSSLADQWKTGHKFLVFQRLC
jgi:hypothetical protein